jgi:hypothetical protein
MNKILTAIFPEAVNIAKNGCSQFGARVKSGPKRKWLMMTRTMAIPRNPSS